MRYAISSLYRPGNQTRIIVLGTGLGVFFIVATYFLQMNLMREFDMERHSKYPNLYLIDIQVGSKGRSEEFDSDNRPAKMWNLFRLFVPNFCGQWSRVNFENPEHRKDRDRLGFEYNLTYRSKLQSTEEIVEGKFWDDKPSQ